MNILRSWFLIYTIGKKKETKAIRGLSLFFHIKVVAYWGQFGGIHFFLFCFHQIALFSQILQF